MKLRNFFPLFLLGQSVLVCRAAPYKWTDICPRAYSRPSSPHFEGSVPQNSFRAPSLAPVIYEGPSAHYPRVFRSEDGSFFLSTPRGFIPIPYQADEDVSSEVAAVGPFAPSLSDVLAESIERTSAQAPTPQQRSFIRKILTNRNLFRGMVIAGLIGAPFIVEKYLGTQAIPEGMKDLVQQGFSSLWNIIKTTSHWGGIAGQEGGQLLGKFPGLVVGKAAGGLGALGGTLWGLGYGANKGLQAAKGLGTKVWRSLKRAPRVPEAPEAAAPYAEDDLENFLPHAASE